MEAVFLSSPYTFAWVLTRETEEERIGQNERCYPTVLVREKLNFSF